MTKDNPSVLSDNPSGLCGLLEQKIAIFKDFMSATISLKEMIELHNVEAVEMIIARRRDYTSFIDRLDRAIHRLREENPSYVAKITPDTRKRIKSLTRILENVISKILQLNQDCDLMVKDELDRLRNDLSGLGHSRNWFKGYGGKSGEPRFLDVKT